MNLFLHVISYAAWFVVITFLMFMLLRGIYFLAALIIPRLPKNQMVDMSLYGLSAILLAVSLITGTAIITTNY
jgi:hypothetical protein